jgi:hypothetical protein
LLELLSQQSALANSLIGKYIVDRYAMWQSSHNLKYATGSFDMRYMNVLNTKLIELFDSYTSSSKELWQITGRYAQTFEAGYNLVDLYNWMQCLPNTSEARDIINFFDNTLSYYFRCSNDTPYAHGVNIYFPLTDNWGPESGQEGPYNQAPDYDAIYNTDDIEDSFMKPWSDIVASWYILPA